MYQTMNRKHLCQLNYQDEQNVLVNLLEKITEQTDLHATSTTERSKKWSSLVSLGYWKP